MRLELSIFLAAHNDASPMHKFERCNELTDRSALVILNEEGSTLIARAMHVMKRGVYCSSWTPMEAERTLSK